MKEMSALAINSLLESQMGRLANHNLATVAAKTTKSSLIDRKHYSDGGGHQYSSHGSYGQPYDQHKKKSRSIALTALTLLAFLFFLNILQQCLQEQMEEMNPQVVIMQARIQAAREAEAKEKEAEKRIGQSAEKEKTTASSVVEDDVDEDDEIPSFSKAGSLYRYQKVQVPVQLNSMNKGRH